MTKYKQLTTPQREKGLIELIKDSKALNFNISLIREYERQLKEIQEIIRAEKQNKKIKINMIKRGIYL